MTTRKINKTQLSKSILEMKFMKKTKDKVEKEAEDAEGRAMYNNEITEKMKKGGSLYISEPSFFGCEELLVGRLSYRGMNPEIEKILELEDEASRAIIDRKNEKDVSDKDMANHYNSLVGNMNKKYERHTPYQRCGDNINNRNQRSFSTLKFTKPTND